MNLFSPELSRQRVCERQNSDGTRSVTFKENDVTITVTFNHPTPDAIHRFTHSLHTILRHQLDEETSGGR
ncbi:hypothetical protein [Alicyclobacillus fodiniaquatilis]|uniref:Uncharacterized protein n=1 Tax=Alicyclobacillus fodiniaquatilis TaxID=1661150 RepID=A0ABW4JG05_9BACL